MKTILASIFITAISLNASAFFSVGKFEAMAKKKAMSSSQGKRSTAADSCANFSGKWKGVCEINGEKTSQSTTIDQAGCFGISITGEDGKSLSFDLTGMGMLNTSSSGVLFSLGYIMAGKWSSDKQVIQLEIAALINSPFLPSPNPLRASSQAMLDNGELVVFTKTEGATEGNGDMTCRYAKVP